MSVDGTLAPRALRAWRNAVLGLFALGGVTVSAWGPRLPSLRDSLGVDNSVIGLVLAGVTVGSIAGLAGSSALLARVGPRRAIAAVAMLAGAGLALVALGAGVLGSLPVTFSGFVAVGAGIGALDVMINVEGTAVEAAMGRTLMPLLHAGWSAGAVLGSGIGAAAAALGVDFAWQFLLEAVGIAGAALLCVRAVPVRLPAARTKDETPLRTRVRRWARGWADLRLLVIGLVMLGVELGEGTANSWLTLAVRDDHGQRDAVAAMFFTAFALGETATRVLGGPVVDRLGRVRTVRITTGIGVVGLVLFILGGPAPLVLIGTLLWAVGVSMGFPLGMSAASDGGGADAAARVSVVATIGYLANLGGPPAIGALSDAVGLLNAFWLVAALLAVSLAAAGALRSPRSQRRSRSAER